MLSEITHIFFDLHGTLIDPKRAQQSFRLGLGCMMAQRYGQTPAFWQAIYDEIVADWDSYHVDLNYSNDEGLRDYREGLFRTTRALFVIAELPVPSQWAIHNLAHDLFAAWGTSNTAYPDVHPVMQALKTARYWLGIVTHLWAAQGKAILKGAGLSDAFTMILGSDTLAQFDQNVSWYQKAASRVNMPPQKCLVVDDRAKYIAAAHAAGMHTAHILREPARVVASDDADMILERDLKPLLRVLEGESHDI